jgi:hypothetical protein
MKLKLLIFSLLLFAGMQTANSQCTWWAKSFGSSSSDFLSELAKDGSGNIYATGYFSGTMTMGSFTLTSLGDKDIFLAKISESGTVIWAKAAGGLYEDESSAISLDGSGNIYMGGSFYSSATFESTTINSTGGSQTFIAKYDNNGNLSWVHESDGVGVNSIATFGTKVYYLTNDYYGALVEYTNLGAFVNNTQISNNSAYASRIKVDASGNIIIGGSFSSPTDFGNGTKTPIGGSDVYVLKYTPSKVLSWVQTGGGSNSDYLDDLEIDNLGNPVIACAFSGSINFNGSILNSPTGGGKVLVKFSNSGSQSWLKLSGDSPYSDFTTSISVDAANNIFHYTDKNFSTEIFNGITLTGIGGAVLAKYDASGNIQNAVKLGSSDYGAYKAAVINSNGKIILGDHFDYDIHFGSKKLTSNSNSNDFAIAKIDQFSDLVFKEPAICVVEIDGSTKKNKVVWSTAGMANVNHFNIYRENKIGDMVSIGTVNFGSGNSFIDVNSDPVEREYIYKLSLTDVCGSEYEAADEHKTIHLQMYDGPANRWSLIWTEYWGLDEKYYRIYRGTTELNMIKYDSISANSFTYTDVNAPAGDLFYKVEAVVENLTCGNMPSSNRISTIDFALSNRNSADIKWFSLYPNPAREEITIEVPENAKFMIIDPLGRVLKEGDLAYLKSIDLTNLNKGIYKVFLETESGLKGSKNFVVN